MNDGWKIAIFNNNIGTVRLVKSEVNTIVHVIMPWKQSDKLVISVYH